MKPYRVQLAFTMLVIASLGCNAISQLGNKVNNISNDVQQLATEPAINQLMETSVPPTLNDSTPQQEATADTPGNASNKYPMTDDAFNATDLGDAGLVYYTKMSLEDVMKFYRDAYTAKGYKERKELTTVTGGVFSMVFDGDPSGKAIAIQSVDLGDGSRTVTITMGNY